MVRPPLSPRERERGRRLGALLREARGDRPPAEVAAASGVSLQALRKIESGRVPTPAFFTVTALARALGLALEEIAQACAEPPRGPQRLIPGLRRGLQDVADRPGGPRARLDVNHSRPATSPNTGTGSPTSQPEQPPGPAPAVDLRSGARPAPPASAPRTVRTSTRCVTASKEPEG